jgi:hypothetical protein
MRNYKTTTKRNYKKMMVTVHRELRDEFEPDSFVLDVLNITIAPPRISASLYSEIKESLRGLDENLQLEIVDDLYDYYFRIAKYYTGLPIVDRILSYFYRKIDKEQSHVRKD